MAVSARELTRELEEIGRRPGPARATCRTGGRSGNCSRPSGPPGERPSTACWSSLLISPYRVAVMPTDGLAGTRRCRRVAEIGPSHARHACEVAASFYLNDEWEFDVEAFNAAVQSIHR